MAPQCTKTQQKHHLVASFSTAVMPYDSDSDYYKACRDFPDFIFIYPLLDRFCLFSNQCFPLLDTYLQKMMTTACKRRPTRRLNLLILQIKEQTNKCWVKHDLLGLAFLANTGTQKSAESPFLTITLTDFWQTPHTFCAMQYFWPGKMDNYLPGQTHTHLVPPENWGQCSPGMVCPCWRPNSSAACRWHTAPLLRNTQKTHTHTWRHGISRRRKAAFTTNYCCPSGPIEGGAGLLRETGDHRGQLLSLASITAPVPAC